MKEIICLDDVKKICINIVNTIYDAFLKVEEFKKNLLKLNTSNQPKVHLYLTKVCLLLDYSDVRFKRYYIVRPLDFHPKVLG